MIRTAILEDIPALTDLLTLLFNQEADFKPNTEFQQKGLNSIISNSNLGQIWILEIDGQVLGMISLLYTISTALGGKVAWLEDMIVHPSRRGKGEGTLLLETAMKHAQENACLRITLLTDKTNNLAQNFYKKQGFEISEMVAFRKSF